MYNIMKVFKGNLFISITIKIGWGCKPSMNFIIMSISIARAKIKMEKFDNI